MFEPFLLRPASSFLANLGDNERNAVQRILETLAQDPFHDGRLKKPFAVPPAIVSIYDDGRFAVIYQIVGENTLRIWSVGYAEEQPRLH